MVPNYIPPTVLPTRLAIIAEGPSVEDTVSKTPLSSNSYLLLKGILSKLNIPSTHIFLGYVSEKQSAGWESQSLDSEAVTNATARLKKDLAAFRPNCCLLLGDFTAKVFGSELSVFKDRGSLRYSPIFGVKYVATYRPGEVMRNFTWSPAFTADISKAVSESKFSEFCPPVRKIESWPTFDRLVTRLNAVLEAKKEIAFDLEGLPDQVGVTCYSIATSPTDAFIVPLRNKDASPFWSLEQEVELWRLTAEILGSPDIPKIAHNGMYELFVFALRHKLLIRGLANDTMYKMWEIFCELPKDLGFTNSLFGKSPFHKDERTDPDLTVHHEYCCKDSLVTYECSEEMDKALARNDRSMEHYRFNIRVMKPYLYMQLRGCKIDRELLAHKRSANWDKIVLQQSIVNEMSGQVLNVKSSPQKAKFLYGELGLPEQHRMDKGQKKVTTNFDALCKLYVRSQLPVVLEIIKLIQLRTRFSDLHKFETFADGRMRTNLNPVGTDTGRLSSSATWVEAIVNSPSIDFKTRQKNGVKSKVMELKYKEEIDCLGTNLQNVTKDLRDLFIPDREDFVFWQYDLSGADAWTVAADLAALGNSRMMDHLCAKIKPSIVIVLLTEYGDEVYKWSLDKLKEVHDATLGAVKKVPKLKDSYRCAKACQHGTNYGMQPPLMASLLLQTSVKSWVLNFNDGIVDDIDFKMTHPRIMERFQNLYSNYYGLEKRNEWLRTQLSNHGYLDCANGHRRKFCSIRNRRTIEDSIVRVAASHEPQANTTYATNSALCNMYYDLTNRTARGNLRCEPLLMIHDALAGQCHASQKSWAEEKMNDWFNVPLIIHGIPVTIPVEGGFGPNWKATE
jgi:uracil-DNA glycosylase